MDTVASEVERVAAETAFTGVVRVDGPGDVAFARAYGMAHRGWSLPNTVDTRFSIASGTKALTSLVLLSLVDGGVLDLETTARSLLRDDLPLIDDRVTVENLLAHRSGIGDYFDETVHQDMTDYVMPVPVHQLVTTEDYLVVLDGHPQVFAPDARFAYNNGAFVVLALLAERASSTPFPDLVRTRVCEPAGMRDTAFLRADEPGEGVALGYLGTDGLRTNVLHLPVRGTGDGGIATTAADVHALWSAMCAGRVVSPERVADMLRPRSEVPSEGARYGMGFWLDPTGTTLWFDGGDAGVSFRSAHDPASGVTWTVLSNSTEGAWPVARLLHSLLDT